jgi:hypothetical protein
VTGHPFCSWIYRRSETECATVRRCQCGAEERVTPRPVRVTVTVTDLPLAITAGGAA